MNNQTKKILWQATLVILVIFIVTGLLIIPPRPAPQNYLLSILAVLAGARLFAKYR